MWFTKKQRALDKLAVGSVGFSLAPPGPDVCFGEFTVSERKQTQSWYKISLHRDRSRETDGWS